MGKDVIIACDFATKKETLKFLSCFKKQKPFIKIGMELFYSTGPSFIRELKKKGYKIFLDLKLHDIPNTVRKCTKVLSHLNVDMITVHAGGTKAMMRAAIEGATKSNGSHPLMVAVTQLTSTDQKTMENEILIRRPLNKVVVHYAQMAKDSKMSGVVCSAQEAALVHKVCGKKFITVTPGIRFTDNKKSDQKRVMTPAQAKKVGSDYIVVGRPITLASNPLAVYKRCIKDFVDKR